MGRRLTGPAYLCLGLPWLWLGIEGLADSQDHWRWLTMALGLLLIVYGGWLIRAGSRSVRAWDGFGLLFFTLLFLRIGFVESFGIGSNSMLPNLRPGDTVLVNRLAYSCLWGAWFCAQPPARGDVIVYQSGSAPGQYLVKRILGLPGERITYHSDRLVIDDRVFSYRVLPEVSFISDDGESIVSPSFLESSGAYQSRILEQPFPLHAKDAHWRVPRDHFFVLGDNRDYSQDSRFAGYVPRTRILGRVAGILWSRDRDTGRVHWGRTLAWF